MRDTSVAVPSAFLETEDFDHLVVPSARLARELRYTYEHNHIVAHLKSWRQPSILSYDQWVITAYNHLSRSHPKLAERSLISPETLLLIAQRTAPDSEIEMHAPAITQAWRLAWQYNLWSEFGEFQLTENGYQCAQWFDRIRRFLERNEFITASEIPDVLQRAIEREDWEPKSVLAYGFSEPSTSQRNLLNALETRSYAQLIEIENDHEPADQSVVQFESRNAERSTMAMWAREKLAEFGEGARIGIVVNDLEASNHSLKRQFENAFPQTDDITQLVSIDTAIPFKQTRLYSDFSTLVEWTLGEVSYTRLLQLAKSPYFDKLELARKTEPFFSESMTIRYYSRRIGGERGRVLKQLTDVLPRRQKDQMTFQEATDLLRNILQICGLTMVSKDEFAQINDQAVVLFVDSIQRISNITYLQPRLGWADFVALVDTFLSDQSMNLASIQEPIQVLDQTSSEHLHFDAIWVTGMSDADWPSPIRPNPFIPVTIQREANVPLVSPDSSLNRAKQLTRNWCTHAREVVFSYYNETDEVEATVSAILNNEANPSVVNPKDLLDSNEYVAYAHPWANHVASHATQEFKTACGVSKTPETIEKSRMSMLKNQAECPFKSWASHRLECFQESTPDTVLPDAAIRGTLFHNVAEAILTKAPNSEQIREVTEADLREAIEQAINDLPAYKPTPSRFKVHEIERTLKLAIEWLKFETNRPDFKVIGIEKEIETTIGGLPFSGRIDRIDKTQDSSHAVIDFKTGKSPRVKHWDPEQLQDTQMPIYATSEEGCDALAYLKVFRDRDKIKTNFEILSSKADPASICEFTGKPIKDTLVTDYESFDNLKKAWTQKLNQLVSDNLRGYAAVDPVSNDICKYCDLQNHCRIHEVEDDDSY